MSSARLWQVAAAAAVVLATAACGGGPNDEPGDLGTPVGVASLPADTAHEGDREVGLVTEEPSAAEPAGEQPPSAAPEPSPAEAQPISVTVAGATTPVVPVGVDGARALDVPRDLDTFGWWREGALAGSREGFVVITGHATRDGRSPANRWWELEPGDEVTVSTAKGDLAYRVTSRTSYPYDDMPYDRWFPTSGPTGEPALALITCSDFRDGAWHANTVVEAVPLPA